MNTGAMGERRTDEAGSAPELSPSASRVRASVFAELAPHIESYTRRGGDLIGLHIGDTHLPPPEVARYARHEPPHFDAGLYQYGSIAGETALREALSSYLSRKGRGDYDPRHEVLVACGATHALFCAARAALEPGDEVLVAAPYWPLSVGVLRSAGLTPVEVPFSSVLYEDPHADAGALFAAKITPRTRALYLATPNNPDGKVLSPAQRAAVAQVARQHNLWILSDEVYADYAYEARARGEGHGSVADEPAMRERTLRLFSLSKSHALAGARVGMLVGPEALVRVAQRVSTHSVYNVPVLSQRVAVSALCEGDRWVAEARALYRAARDASAEALVRAGLRFHKAEGGAYHFIDFTPVLAGRPLAALLERAIAQGVLLVPGGACGEDFASHARLCFIGAPSTRVLEGIARLARAVDAL